MGGRTKPLQIGCEAQDGTWAEYVVKLRDPGPADGTPYGLCLVRELVGAALARFLGLNVPPYALVNVDDAFAASVAHLPDGGRIARNRGLCFGSLFVEGTVEDPLAPSPDEWAPVIGFDAMGFNADRKASNPNVLWTGERLFAIDHGFLAPLWTFGVDGTSASSLYGLANIRLHAAAQRLAKSGESYNEVPDRWRQLSIDLRNWLLTEVPADWATGADVVALLDFLWDRVNIAIPQARELTTYLA
jgi:hypothetical protein